MTNAGRASLVDVFENALGDRIEDVSDDAIASLASHRADELVDHLDQHLAAAAHDTFADDAVTLDGFASPIAIPYHPTERRTTDERNRSRSHTARWSFPFKSSPWTTRGDGLLPSPPRRDPLAGRTASARLAGQALAKYLRPTLQNLARTRFVSPC